MSGNFEWQTEDEIRSSQQAAWDDPPYPPTSPKKTRHIPWRLLALVTVLLAGVGLTVWWRVQVQIDATMQSLRNDVASSYNLVQLAATDQDEELFRSVLSGRDPDWTASQLELFDAGLLFDRTPLGLTVTPDSLPQNLPVPFDDAVADEVAVSIEFTPDLNEAVLTSVQPFVVTTAQGVTDTVLLEQTMVFRRGTQRWLLAPSESDFWGDRQTIETNRLRVEYPARDEAVAIQLAGDLSKAIDRLCAGIADLGCSDELGLTLRLETDLGSLASLAKNSRDQWAYRDVRQGNALILPAPTLIGRPLEENLPVSSGYQALLNAYRPAVLEAVITDSTAWECCQQGALFHVLLDHQLAELGYGEWPIASDDYQQILTDGTRFSDLVYLWRRPSGSPIPAEDQWRLYLAIDFLLNSFPDLTPANMQRLLPVAPNMEEWLSRLLVESDDKVGNSWVLNSLDQAWWIYALQGTLMSETPPIPVPDESLYLACTAEEGSQRPGPASVYRYDLATTTWTSLLSVEGFVWMSPLPSPDALLMQQFVLAEETWQTNLWRDGASQPLYRTDTGFSISFGETDPDGRQLVTYAWEPEQDQTDALLLDLDTCTSDGCDFSRLQGVPRWSPDGQRAVYSGDQATLPTNTLITNERVIIFDPSEPFYERALTLGPSPTAEETVSSEPIGTGYSPFWLDEQTFGYIHVIRDGSPGPAVDEEVVVATVDNQEPRTILTSADLYEYLPAGQDSSRITLAYVVPHPIDRELVFVVAVDELRKDAFVFSYDLATRQPQLRLQVRYDLNHSFSFSPDGRYLIVTGRDHGSFAPRDNSGILYLHDIAANRTTPFAIRLPFFLSSVTYDWTDDSNWLVLAMDDNLVGLIAPDHHYVDVIPHSFGTCTSVAWLQE